ncbi:MFS transporter [Nocardiopsis kunsanensis]|uniref:MFS transporter n=1 Tax=Nocardiopsis kunsanensis TaxID=141693 RepID=A0A918X841_9ACTN|nr:MFS transporter [Nocardiopsis kunsanensis]
MPPSGRAGAKEWVGLLALALPLLLIAMDNNVLFLAVPHISADLGASSTQILWIQDIYTFMVAGFLITMGKLGDRIGRRKLLLLGAIAFGVASVLAALSVSAEMLIATRILLGVAGAALAPTCLSLVVTLFPDSTQRTSAIAVLMTCFMGGAALGPAVGGMLLQYFWWGSVFLMGVPVMLLTLLLGPLLLPEYKEERPGSLDFTSVGLSLAAAFPLIYGLKELANDGFRWNAVLAIAVGVVFAYVFVRRQNALESPLLDMRLFRLRSFSGALGTLLIGQLLMGGTLLMLAQYIQVVLGMEPIAAGLWMLLATVAMGAMAPIVPKLVVRIDKAVVIACGLTVATVGFLCFAFLSQDPSPVLLGAGMVLAFAGTAPLIMLAIDLVVGSAPTEKAGSAAAMSETSSQFGLALGVAALGSLGTVVYRSALEQNLPEGIPQEAAQAAQESVVAGAGAADGLSGDAAVQMTDAVFAAFTTGMNTVATAAAVLAPLAALVVFGLLRGVGQEEVSGEAEGRPQEADG